MKFEVTLKDIYGTDTPKVPEGYEISEFRYPRFGDLYINCCNQKGEQNDNENPWLPLQGPRAILRPKPKPLTDTDRMEAITKWFSKKIFSNSETEWLSSREKIDNYIHSGLLPK